MKPWKETDANRERECGEKTNTGNQISATWEELLDLEGTRERVMMDSGTGAEISLMQAAKDASIIVQEFEFGNGRQLRLRLNYRPASPRVVP